MRDPIRVGQLTDTHFIEPGGDPEGGHGYDTAAAFDAVADHLDRHHAALDLLVVTGDVADHGRAEEYEIAFDAFGRLGDRVTVCPGNHDFDDPFRSAIVGSASEDARVIELGDWAFVFVDSSAGVMVAGEHGALVDPPDQDRLHSNGSLGEREAAWVRDACAAVGAEHVFVWVHHPPAANVPLAADDAYTAEWTALLADLPAIRGFGGGHTHVPSKYALAGRDVFVAPALKNNFDLTANTWLPPGYRTYEFHPDGRVTSEVHLVDDERWPRRPFGRALRSLFMGELTYAELAEIAARRAARNDS